MRRFLKGLIAALLVFAPAVAMAQTGADALILFGKPKPALDLNLAATGAFPSSVTFSRASTGTYTNSAGTLTTASSGTPRFTYDPVTLTPLGYLSEEADTNLELQSNAFLTGWAILNSTLTAAATTSPDGTADGWSFQRSSTSSATVSRGAAKAASALVYTGSIFAKISNCNFVALRIQGTFPARVDVVFDLSAGTISSAATAVTFTSPSATITPAGNGWYRISVTGTSDTAATISLIFSASTNGVVVDGTDSSGSSAAFFYQTDLVQSSNLTSPIPTTTVQVTRAADVATVALSATSIPAAPSALTIISKFMSPVGFDTTKTYTPMHLDDGTSANSIDVRFNSAANSPLLAQSVIANVSQLVLTAQASSPAATTVRAWFAYAPGNSAGQVIGQTKATSAAATPLPPMTVLRIGKSFGTAPLNSTIARLQIYNTRLPDGRASAIAAGL